MRRRATREIKCGAMTLTVKAPSQRERDRISPHRTTWLDLVLRAIDVAKEKDLRKRLGYE